LGLPEIVPIELLALLSMTDAQAWEEVSRPVEN
jgi:hypothetical protein